MLRSPLLLFTLLIFPLLAADTPLPKPEAFHIYLLCGQSNMAGRGTDIQLGGNLDMRLKTALKGDETPDQVALFETFARQAAIAIDNSRLLVTLIRKNQQLQQAQEQLTRRVRDLELLFELERATAHAMDNCSSCRAT